MPLIFILDMEHLQQAERMERSVGCASGELVAHWLV